MGTLTEAEGADKPRVTVSSAEGGAVVVRIVAEPSPAPADRLRPVAAIATDWGLEVAGLRAALRRAGVRTVRVGRAVCARERDVLGIVERLGAAESSAPKAAPDPYASLVARSRGRR